MGATVKPKLWNKRPPGTPASYQDRWNAKSKTKLQAHAIVRQAIRDGRLKRGRCEICGSFRVDGHHIDYSKPLEVTWLCRRHHQQLHAEMRRAAE